MRIKPSVLGVGCAVLCAASLSAEAATIYVNAGHTAPPWNGRSWATAYRTLQPALQESVEGDEIWVARGLYLPSSDDSRRQASFALQKNVAVIGGFSGNEVERAQRNWEKNVTILSGNLGRGHHVYHVLVGADQAVLDGFTVSEGRADGLLSKRMGGGMLNRGKETVVVRHCIFKNNYAAWGGAIYNGLFATPLIEQSSFVHNKAKKGGAILSQTGAVPIVKNCVFKHNVTLNDQVAAAGKA